MTTDTRAMAADQTPITVSAMLAEARRQVADVAPEELAELRDAEPDLVLLDVREPEEYALGHLPGSVHIPRGKLEFLADPASSYADPRLNPDRPVAVYCQKGPRAILAAATLQRLGYRQVVNVAGGYEAWMARAGTPAR